MKPGGAQYLIRCDDLCPTMGREGWVRVSLLIREFGLKPILAVVPDNRDRALECSGAAPAFWREMRALEVAGATIGLHGYQHLCSSTGKSLVPLHRHSEFAGVPLAQQQQWIRGGLAILRNQSLNPRIWVAPRHGFDAATLQALREEGIELVSDGLARTPFVRGGLTWIPQQLWAPMEKSHGVWTICIHPNTARRAELDQLREFVRANSEQFTSVDRVLVEWTPVQWTAIEWVHEMRAELQIRTSKIRRRMREAYAKGT